MVLPPALTALLGYFGPLSTVRRDFRGAATLHTPEVNVLALNATYLPDEDPGRLPLVRAWHRAHDVPPLVATVGGTTPGEAVLTVRVGPYLPVPDPGVLRVEQVGRLLLPTWAAVLAEAYDASPWAGPLARHLAARLEGDPNAALLLAYAGPEVVGALLWRASAAGGAAHLWGTLDPAADAPLLNAAHGLGGALEVSLPDRSPLSVVGGTEVTFGLLEGGG